MQLERLALVLRPRHNWEAVDLGIRFAVQQARLLYASHLGVALSLALLVYALAALSGIAVWWAALLIWWLKPAFDRVALHVLSHAAFGERIDWRSVWRALPRLWWNAGLLRELTLARFSPYRSTLLAVSQLEGLRGRAARQRRNLILRRMSGTALLLTWLWPLLEVLFVIAALSLGAMLLPAEILEQIDWPELFFADDEGQPLVMWLYYGIYQLGSFLLEPLYVSAGFSLYLKRRTELEAWDVELQFRQIASAQAASAQRGLLALAALCLGLLLLQPAPAQASPAREQALQQAGERIQPILDDPVFGETKTEHKLRKRERNKPDAEDKEPAPWLKGLMHWLDSLQLGDAIRAVANFFASLGRIGGWLLILAVVLTLVYLLTRLRPGGSFVRRRVPPAELAGFDIRPESLPDDLAASAEALARDGQLRAALSLLFRGSLSHLAHGHQVSFIAGDTEGDCLVRTRREAPALASFLARLLGAWQRLAYAHQTIGIDEVALLCQQWRQHFASGAAHAE